MSDHPEHNDPNNGETPPSLGAHMFQVMASQHAQIHVQGDTNAKIGTAVVVEQEAEYRLLAERAAEFDFVLSESGAPATLEMAAAGFARHMLCAKLADDLSEVVEGSTKRGEYRAQHFEHSALRVRWMTRMAEIVDHDERMRAAVAAPVSP